MLFTTSFAYGEKSEALKSYTTENLNYTEMVEKEINDDIFLEFVDGDIVEEPSKNVEIYERYNYNPKNKNKKYNGHYMAFEKDKYGIVASNIDKLDEEYIISSKVFELTDINDGFEPFNRRMYAFNTQLDRKVMYPASQVYAAIVPKPIRIGIENFYNNFKEIPTMFNSLLQFKPKKAANAFGRFAINSTIGLLGTNDVAKKFGLKKDWETMGDTLGVYGVPTGSYLVLPVLGPSTLRDGLGSIADSAMEGYVKGKVETELFFDTGVFDKSIYGFTRPVVTGLNARSLIGFRYGDLNSPFEYENREKETMDKIKRIEEMEKIMDKSADIFNELNAILDKLCENLPDYKKLDEYYSSQDWFSDVEDSNNNLLPEDLKCGVLSEDGAYNLFGDNHELAIRMVEIAAKMLRR